MILDTNAVSALADGSPALAAAARDVAVFCLPVITLGEFQYGVRRSRHRKTYEAWLARLQEISHVLIIEAETTQFYASIRDELRERGRPIPSNDTWIAALALQHRLPILSRDQHFDEVKGVQRISW